MYYSWARSCAPIPRPPRTGYLLPHRGGGNRTWQREQLQCQGSTETCTGPLPVWSGPVGILVGFHCTLLHCPESQGWEACMFNVGNFIYKAQQHNKLCIYTYTMTPKSFPLSSQWKLSNPQLSCVNEK